MFDWSAVFQTFLASGIVSGGIGAILVFVFKKYTDRRIDHVFKLKLKEHEEWLRRASELQIQIGKDRIEEYKKLSALLMRVRKNVIDLCEKDDPTSGEITAVMAEVKDIENMIYDLSLTLFFDDLFPRIHSYKVALLTLVKNVENEKQLRLNGQTQRANDIRESIYRSIAPNQEECKSIVGILKTKLVRPSRLKKPL